ncbi:uncharacterized protein DUF4247 [Haloactinopolyspora alba]|uniref:Uncharacterized protein DUF4247 n=1 Tax=Haloactinopolyspora alba TaxID=648780 RepID=A0A2P8EFU3_9ACTN|nr:DUF4247 domain-containing protein [Haloactinopolyspora alba]PSL08336.1 uncharacterized protein DUF4247 [Haloactinopolyspora alba]
MRGTGARALVAAVTALVTLTACSSTEEQVRNFVDENYERVSESGEYAAYRSSESVDDVADDIESAATPGRQHEDETGEYLGYEEVMVHVEEEPSGSGSTIEVTDASDGYDRWGVAIIPVWGTFGGSYRNAFSGGGSGFGK